MGGGGGVTLGNLVLRYVKAMNCSKARSQAHRLHLLSGFSSKCTGVVLAR